MTRSRLSRLAWLAALTLGTYPAVSRAQASPSSSSQSQSAPSQTSPRQTDDPAKPPAESKKPKKIWTNDNVGDLNGPVSVVGNSKNLGNPGSGTKADAQYIANAKKQLQKLQSDLDDTDKRLSDLRNFSEGKPATTSSGYEINKGYNRIPVDQQISNLESKKKQLEGKIDALLDEARKKGVLPGDLR